jgi:hypothetical protein
MATKDKRQRGPREGILGLLSEEDLMQSSVYEMGEKRGEEKGKREGKLELLLRGYERRLGRALNESEQDTIKLRLGTLGADRLFDVQMDLSSEALAAWLADPAAQ